jgi:Ca2+-binding EF-hand superfamily protein
MPTEYTRAVLLCTDAEDLCKTIDAAAPSALSYASLSKILSLLDTFLANFRIRITKEIYGPSMISKVNVLFERRAAIDIPLEVIKNALPAAPPVAASTQEETTAGEPTADKAEGKSDVPPSPPMEPANKRQHVEAPPPLDVSVEDQQVKPPQQASVVVPQVVPAVTPDEKPSNPFSLELRSDSIPRTRALAAERVTAIAAALGIASGTSLKRADAELLLAGLFLSRLPPPAPGRSKLSNLPGWKRWATIEAKSAFILIDTDKSGTMEYSEFTDFIATSPMVFGALAHIEELFDVYDANKNGLLEAEELSCLFLEVLLEECGEEEPDICALQAEADSRTEMALMAMGSNRSKENPRGSIDFKSFVKCVHEDPSLLATAANLRRHFVKFDADGNGELDREEFKQMVTFLTETQGIVVSGNDGKVDEFVDKLFAQADADGSGSVDFPEFVKYAVTSNLSTELLPRAFGAANIFNTLKKRETDGIGQDPEDESIGYLGEGSFFAQLMAEKKNALGLTDAAKPVISVCEGCGCPLIGVKMGICAMGMDFCDQNCKNKSDVDWVSLRAAEHARFSKGGEGKQRLDEALSAQSRYSKHHRFFG